MQTTVHESTISSSDKTTHMIAGLIGYIPELQFLQLIQTDNLVETRSQEELHTVWEAAAARRTRLTNHPSPSLGTAPLPQSLASYEREIRERVTYKRYYEGSRLCLVPVQELITPQWYVNLDYIDTLKRRVPQPGQLQEALDLVCDEGGVTLTKPCASNLGELPSLALQTPAYRDLVTSFAPLRPFEVQQTGPQKLSLTIHVDIEVKPNYLLLAKIGARYLIVNGVHRALTFLQAGWQRIPCLVRDAAPTTRSLAELGFQQAPGLLPDEYTLKGTRPAYLSDYLDPIVAPHFQRRNVEALWHVIPQVLTNKQVMP
jgi:hypothetical protein